MQKEASIQGGDPNPVDTAGLCLLSLDGGGVRGLSSLYILKNIMDRLNHARAQLELPPVKPCEVFDLIGGTSTGGLIAIMLGRLEMNVDQCIDAYSGIAAAVFGEKLRSLPINFKGDITAKFDSKKLERAIQKVIEDSGASAQDLFNDGAGLKDGTARGCRTFVCAADRHTKDIIRLRSYSLPHEPNISATICQAALATSAATSFFEPVSVGNRSFADGGLGANNPVDQVEGEASNIWCPETGELKQLVKCFISIGTGNPGKKPFEDKLVKFLGQTVIQIATETENTEKRFIERWARHYDEKRYFRFNVDQGLQEIGLEEYKKTGPMEAATEGYLTHMAQKFRVRDCIQNMRLKENKTGASFAITIKEHTIHTLRQQPVDRFNVPLDLNASPVITRFVGRQDKLDDLWRYLQPIASPSRKIAILHGLGGIGKTQLALRFARDHKDDFTAIFWLSGKNRDALLQSLSSALNRLPAQDLDIEASNDADVGQRARHMLRWLALDGNSRWLVIFDNIDQYSPCHGVDSDGYDIGEFFPNADHGSILITSRLQRLVELGESFPVEKLDSQSSIELLLQSSGSLARNKTSNFDSNPDTLTLANRLDGLPLAIVIAGAFMRETGTSITEYLQYYQQSWSELQLKSSPGRQYQQGNILQTWMVSYLEIQKRDPSAADLLLLLAHFDNRDIWYELVRRVRHSSNIPDWLNKATSSGLAFKTGVKSLIGFSLLESKQQEGSYAIHPVVQDWCLHVTNENKDVNRMQLNELVLISVGHYVLCGIKSRYAKIQQRLLPHANHVHHLTFLNGDIKIWGAFHGLGILYSDQSKLKEAEDMYQRALAGKEKALGPNHTSTLLTVNSLGELYSTQGKLKEAEEMFQRALLGYKKARGPDHTLTLTIVSNLGTLYKDQGKLKEAEEMYQRALAGFEKAFGPDHPSTLDILNDIGLLRQDQGKLKETEEILQRVLAGYEKAFSNPGHISILMTVHNLAVLYIYQGKLKETEEMCQRALASYEKARGPDHGLTLRMLYSVAFLYKGQGKLKEAEEMYQRALASCEKALSPNHGLTLRMLSSVAFLYEGQGKLKEAEEMYQRALAGYEKARGPDHILTTKTVDALVILLSNQGRLKEADEIYQRALASKKKALGHTHGRCKEAEEHQVEGMEIMKRRSTLDHPHPLPDALPNSGNHHHTDHEGTSSSLTSEHSTAHLPPYSVRSEYVTVPRPGMQAESCPATALYLVSDPLPANISILELRITSHYQRFCGDPSKGSWTWFEASIIRPWLEQPGSDFEDLQHSAMIKSHPEDFGDLIQERGWYFANIPILDDGRSTSTDSISRKVLDNPVSHLWSVHNVSWSKDETGGDFVSLLQEGDRLLVWARAQYACWVNYVREVQIALKTTDPMDVQQEGTSLPALNSLTLLQQGSLPA